MKSLCQSCHFRTLEKRWISLHFISPTFLMKRKPWSTLIQRRVLLDTSSDVERIRPDTPNRSLRPLIHTHWWRLGDPQNVDKPRVWIKVDMLIWYFTMVGMIRSGLCFPVVIIVYGVLIYECTTWVSSNLSSFVLYYVFFFGVYRVSSNLSNLTTTMKGH